MFSNPWVIGVGGGLISGLIVTLITRYLFSRREQREYRQKIETANNEIIYAIRPAIAEKVIPSSSMLDSLFSATARKYGVNKSDLYSKIALGNDLIKEVMDNTFLSSQQKVDFCELLSELKQVDDMLPEKQRIEVIRITKRESTDSSIILGISTAMMAMLMTVFVYVKDRDAFFAKGEFDKLFPMIAMLTVIPIVAFMMMEMLKRLRRLTTDDETDETPVIRTKEKIVIRKDKEPEKDATKEEEAQQKKIKGSGLNI